MDGQSPNVVTLRLPKLNWQIGALILIALIAGFQTFQLARLKGSVSLRPASATTAAAAPAGAPASNSGLQGMVGGC